MAQSAIVIVELVNSRYCGQWRSAIVIVGPLALNWSSVAAVVSDGQRRQFWCQIIFSRKQKHKRKRKMQFPPKTKANFGRSLDMTTGTKMCDLF